MKIEYMNRKKTIIIIIVITIVAIAIPLAVYTVSPLFINTREMNRCPLQTMETYDGHAIREFNKFMEMSEQERRERGHQMGNEERDMIMIGLPQTNVLLSMRE